MQAAHAGTHLQLRLSRGRSVVLNRFSPPKIREKETRQTSLLRKLELIKKLMGCGRSSRQDSNLTNLAGLDCSHLKLKLDHALGP